jgi:glycerol-3-phosphate dehydrogenase
MAKLAVDRLVEREARSAPCRTDDIPLGQAVDAADLPRVEGVTPEAYEHLARRYGHSAREVLAIAAQRGELTQPIVAGGPPDLLAEAVHAARREQATSVGDALLRRTRVGLLAARRVADPAGETARRVAVAMAAELGWAEERAESESRAFLDEATAEGIVTDP